MNNNRNRSLLAGLRQLVPKRQLSFTEALRITELQANRFRELLGITMAELTDEALAAVPRVAVTYESDLPVSGLAQWHNGHWIVALNALEPEARQRFSLAHELFHIINHTTRQWLHPGDALRSSDLKAEKLADYFAGCLLAPKRHVKALAGQGLTPAAIAAMLGVSLPAISVRLSQLGLTEPVPRCVRPVNRWQRVVEPYRRATTKSQLRAS